MIKLSLWFLSHRVPEWIRSKAKGDCNTLRSFLIQTRFCNLITQPIILLWSLVHSSNPSWHRLYAQPRVRHRRCAKEGKQSSAKHTHKKYVSVGEKTCQNFNSIWLERRKRRTSRGLPSLFPPLPLRSLQVRVPRVTWAPQGRDPWVLAVTSLLGPHPVPAACWPSPFPLSGSISAHPP